MKLHREEVARRLDQLEAEILKDVANSLLFIHFIATNPRLTYWADMVTLVGRDCERSFETSPKCRGVDAHFFATQLDSLNPHFSHFSRHTSASKTPYHILLTRAATY